MEFISLFIVLIVSAIFPGIINRVRARLSGRKGMSVYQHLLNVELLLRKSSVYSYSSTWITRAVPIFYLASSLTLVLFVPVGQIPALLSFNGDIVMFAYLMALTRFGLIISAMDSGSSFQGMGASREAFYGALVEPALFILGGTLALISGHVSFSHVFSSLPELSAELSMVLILIGYALTLILSVEMGRIPVDDTRTHLELTMIHEVMVLDYCGVDLAMITIGGWLKMGALAILASNAVSGALMGNWLLSVVLSLGVAVFVAFVESFRAKNKLARNSTYILTITALALVLFLVTYILLQNIFI